MHPEVFGDIRPLVQEDVRLFCHRSGKIVSVPPCDILVAGYPCKPLSGLNPSPIRFSEHAVQKAIMAYCLRMRPQVLIFENVKQMTQRRKVDAGEASPCS